MTVWHADDALLAAYAGGGLDQARAASVEQHLTGCASCRAAIAPHADAALIARAWAGTVDRLDRPRTSPFERLLIALGLSPSAARLATGASAARRAWVAGCVLVAGFAIAAREMDGPMALWFLTVAPLAPLTGVALAYGPGVFSMHEVVAAAPYPRLRLVLLRCLPVLPMTVLLLVVGGLVLPGTAGAALWLLPGLALAALGLVAERLVGVQTAIGGLAALWMGGVASARITTGSVLGAFSPTVQLLSSAIVLGAVCLALVGARRTRSFW
ncbi:zf-HC2 domain-containing protein [Jidongwangia harbinensis]|uniref:zf-HC2 domain-containing protein n=1 Tax=Jidongwangia harbinensis TaxID=2878561 RepID=UPI001CD97F43|nr:zf-HC2 domain-containing protein [Jidongwangia harbinensis]MCA2216272.1 zf-HC2 domain-containing protein [Jidongwangia harbinensis]MCA2217007.1 zf-HC2 domain-containing protein [Jidongwangia harbinensis]